MNNTLYFYQLLPGDRFLHNNKECVKLQDGIEVKMNYGGEYKNAVSLDKGELIHVSEYDQVINIVRSY